MNDGAKLIVYGTVIRKSGAIQDVYFVYAIEDGKAAVGVSEENGGMVYVNEPYSRDWRRLIKSTYTELGYRS